MNFHISPHSRIIEKCEGTTGGVSSNSLLRVALSPRLGQVLVQVSPEHLHGWRSPRPSGHLCQCWATLGVGEHIFLIHSQNFPCCKLCPLRLALCHSEKSPDQSSLKRPFRWWMTSFRPSPFSLLSLRLSKSSLLSLSSYTITPTSHPSSHISHVGSPKLYTLIFLFSTPLMKYSYSSFLFPLSLPVILAIISCP